MKLVSETEFYNATQVLNRAAENKQVIIKRSTGEIETVNNVSFNVGYSNLGRGITDTANVTFRKADEVKAERVEEIRSLIKEKQAMTDEMNCRIQDLKSELYHLGVLD